MLLALTDRVIIVQEKSWDSLEKSGFEYSATEVFEYLRVRDIMTSDALLLHITISLSNGP